MGQVRVYEEVREELHLSQNDEILKYMKDFGTITSLQALADLGCMRLASRISDLRRAGYNISREMVIDTNRYGKTVCYARYRLED